MPKTNKRYYFCAYGHVGRYAYAVTPEKAALEAFGVTERVTVLDVGPKSPAYLSTKTKQANYTKLAELHKEATGNVLQ